MIFYVLNFLFLAICIELFRKLKILNVVMGVHKSFIIYLKDLSNKNLSDIKKFETSKKNLYIFLKAFFVIFLFSITIIVIFLLINFLFSDFYLKFFEFKNIIISSFLLLIYLKLTKS